ncbi:unnamed protein product, partial [Mesorhabditis belari]|uniref:Uncharacterized protein n=1 Tax=Mesorhabditis belari TaxID=2138241 RepID=A0AAF3F0B6_9BILA
MERLPARVIENTVRQLSKNCYRRVELRRERLPRVYIDELCVQENMLRFIHGGRNEYSEKIDPAKLIQHLAYLNERVTFNTLRLQDVNWDMFANCKFECEELTCFVIGTTLSPERFQDIFRSIRPTRNLYVSAHGDNKVFPVTRDFFTNNYAIELQLVRLWGYGNAMVDPLNDTILLDSTALSVKLMQFIFEQFAGKQNVKISCTTYLDCNLLNGSSSKVPSILSPLWKEQMETSLGFLFAVMEKVILISPCFD